MASQDEADLLPSDLAFMDAPSVSVLVADDASLWRRKVVEALRRGGGSVVVHEAVTGQEALDILSERRIDVAFVDLTMPEINGDEVIERLKGEKRMPFFAIISVTSDAERIAKMRHLAAYDYLVKPFDAEAVQRVMQTYGRITQPTRVLVIDDSGTTLGIIRRLLERSIFRVEIEAAKDGVSAFEFYARRPADIVFIDLNMPDLDGVKTLRIFRALDPHVRVVLMSSDQASLNEARLLAATEQLKKPFAPSDIDAIFHRLYGLPVPYIEGSA